MDDCSNDNSVKKLRAKHKGSGQGPDEKHIIRVRPKDTPGVICIERHIHDEAIVISGSLTVEFNCTDVNSLIEEELEAAAREVKESGGVLGQIKTALTVTSTSMISVTEEKAMATETMQKYAKIMLAAIIFMVSPKEAEDILRKALAGVRKRLREEDCR